jgi:RimJ/RimL family protein N-acetyltransferase
MNLSLREIIPEDEALLFRVYSSSRAAEMAMTGWTEEQREAFLRSQYNAQRDHYQKYFSNAEFKVILFNGQPVGRLYLLRETHRDRIIDIAIVPEARRQGIATHLLKNLMQLASASKKSLTIYVETFNPALGLFQRLGFKSIENDDINFLMEYKEISSDI